jgi:hypothetical protein
MGEAPWRARFHSIHRSHAVHQKGYQRNNNGAVAYTKIITNKSRPHLRAFLMLCKDLGLLGRQYDANNPHPFLLALEHHPKRKTPTTNGTLV